MPPINPRHPALAAAGGYLKALLCLLALMPFSMVLGETIDFARDIRPILSENCFHCHGPDEEHREADLRLDLKEHAFAKLDGVSMIEPGDAEASDVWYRISTDDKVDVMPPPKSHKSLTAEEKQLIAAWIESGAEWSDHWSFVPPDKAPVTKSKHPIDHFIQAGLKQSNLSLNAEADPVTLARRLHLDLTGLPPTPERVESFLESYKVDPKTAYNALVYELLASRHFGERMALMWLDAARYGDTSVMHADGPRTMWPWRDWVVQAYNQNMPFDQFSMEQLAGDLIPNATVDQKIASGFNRNHASSDEGGAIPEELRVSYVVDRVQTTSNVWMGLTMECAQCHDHKYDPISQREYYQFYAFFNNHTDPGMQTRKGNQSPVVTIQDPLYDAKLEAAKAKAKLAQETLDQYRGKAAPGFEKWLASTQATQENAAPPGPAKLAHWLPLDEEKGDKLIDQAGALIGTKATGKWNSITKPVKSRAFRLDGRSSFTLRQPVHLPADQPFTISTWIRTEVADANGTILSCMEGSNGLRGYDLGMQKGTLVTHLIHKWPSNAIKVGTTAKLEPKKWYHVVYSYDGSSKASGISMWIDGEKAEIKPQVDKLTEPINANTRFMIGSRAKGSNFRGALSDLRIYREAFTEADLPAAASNPIDSILAIAPEQRNEDQQDLLLSYYLSTQDEEYKKLVVASASARQSAMDLETSPTTSMIMGDNPQDEMRMTYMLNRGSYDQPMKDQAVVASVPTIFPPLPEGAPGNRLGLAKWLFRPDHPLTSRVAVNQIWQVLLGYGLVHTPGDFGAQGSFPTHPELLDWLAVDFRENGWDVKRLVRQIVTSETYRQSSIPTDAALAGDPNNHLLSRANRFRLQAEFIRDTALSTSGLLIYDLGGAGVKPYQPPGLWLEVSLGGNAKFVQDKGEDLYRRSLYTYWKRSSPPPSMLIFDAPTRETCTMQRPRTNTPLQALVTMNDTQFVEAARFLAERMMAEATSEKPEAIAERGFQLVTLRSPNEREMTALMDVYQSSLSSYQSAPESAEALLKTGEAPGNSELPPQEHAAWTVVANLLLNLDETLTRE